MNAVIHFFAAVASIVLVIFILRLQKRLGFVTDLLKNQSQQSGPERIRLVDPSQFLTEFSRVLHIPFENELGVHLPMSRISSRIWTETFLRCGIRLIRCEMEPGGATVEVRLSVPDSATNELERALSQALGNQIRVIISTMKSGAS
ncbi:MAG: hypothetical protein FJ146_04835 [Deltaproteobacteria bacterium]|nr:hypothetical protein [Deltaproteobacteria bacterium]